MVFQGGLSISSGEFYVLKTETGIGGHASLDFPISGVSVSKSGHLVSSPIRLGVEVGFDNTALKLGFAKDDYITCIPIMARVSGHYEFINNLDTYVVAKLGWALGIWSGGYYDLVKQMLQLMGGSLGVANGFAWGIDIGASYYFTDKIGVFAEVGFEKYDLAAEMKIMNITEKLGMPFTKFLTVGLGVKI